MTQISDISFNFLSIKNPYSGAGIVALNIIKHFPESLNILIFCQSEFYNKIKKHNLSNKFKFLNLNFNNIVSRIFFEQYMFPKILNKNKIKILFTISNIIPLKFKGIQIVNIFDIMFKTDYMRYGILKFLYYQFFVSKTVKYADKIFVPTKSTKNKLLQLYNQNLNKKISINQIGYNTLLSKNIDVKTENKILNKFNINYKYFLFVGTMEPGKNLDFLYKLMLLNTTKHKLILVSNKGWKTKLNNFYKIKILQNLTETELSVLYKNADIFLYPSIDEGVGLPVLESQYFNIPVICSDYNAAYEIIDKKYILKPDIDLWLNRINLILNNKSQWLHYNNTPDFWILYCNKLMKYTHI